MDLPAPFSPTRASTSPGSTSKLTSVSTRLPANDFDTFSTLSSGGTVVNSSPAHLPMSLSIWDCGRALIGYESSG